MRFKDGCGDEYNISKDSKMKNQTIRLVNPFGKPIGKILAITIATLVTSCITVNVNFPESAVQRAADDFVQDLYKGTDGTDVKVAQDAVKNDVKKGSKKK